MIDRLFVILGAGASYDCAGGPFVNDARYRPPLVRELFDERFQPILARYPFAQAAAADIVPLLAGGGAFELEKHISTRYRAGKHEIALRKYLSLPLYLQEILYECGRRYARSPDAYDRLITALSEIPHVSFVTLNYDTLLDDRLFALRAQPTSMLWYVTGLDQWSLFKLHGSVNWAYPFVNWNGNDLTSPVPRLINRLEREIVLRSTAANQREIEGIREGPRMGRATPDCFFPALSVPVGAADELVCPPEHLAALTRQLEAAEPVHLLVIGYSGLDQEVIQLLRRNKTRIASLTVVDVGDAAGRAASHILDGLRLREGNLQFLRTYADGFYRFSCVGLEEYVMTMHQAI